MLATTSSKLQRATPESQGITSAAILHFVETVERQIRDFHGFMLLRHGKVVAEGWWSPYKRDRLHMLFSLSKSFTATAVGFAVAEGLFSLDDPVLSFFPDEAPSPVSEHLAAMQVRHLLSMSTGHTEDTMLPMAANEDASWTKAFLALPVQRAPGTHFLYNTGASYMLSAIVQRKTGLKLVDYLQPRLFEPLGIENPVWDESPQGINLGGFGLNTKTEDVAKFGQLYLQKGRWQDRQILPEAWVEEATARHIANGTDVDSDWNQGYAYQFWRCRHNAYRGDGAFGQFCIVMPDQDAVLAITGGLDDMQEPLNLVWDILLPAMGNAPLPDDAAAQQRLAEKLSTLAIPPVEGEVSPATASKVSGRVYTMDANLLNFKTISLNFGESGCTAHVNTAHTEETIACGYGSWHAGETKLFNEPWESAPTPYAASGAWNADHSFEMVIRLTGTPFFHTLIYHFALDDVLIEKHINVSFGSLKPLLFVGRSG